MDRMVPHLQDYLAAIQERTGCSALLVIGGPTLARQGRISVTW